ncbi:MAG TPA: hypothetical protein PKA64_14165 [Myxococcota bacterium]|nr:hypothetical protein [Myxococcota bacterium]
MRAALLSLLLLAGPGAAKEDVSPVQRALEGFLGADADIRGALGKRGVACLAEGVSSRLGLAELASLGDRSDPAAGAAMLTFLDVAMDCKLVGRFLAIGVEKGVGQALSARSTRCIDAKASEQRDLMMGVFRGMADGSEPDEAAAMQVGLLVMGCLNRAEMAAMSSAR